MRTKRTEITIHSERFTLISRLRRMRMWCAGCRQQTELVAAEDVALIAKVSAREIYRLVEAGELHYLETPNGLLLVCLNSLNKAGGLLVSGAEDKP